MSDPYSLSPTVPVAPQSAALPAFALDSWGAVRVSGVDAESFLQGQLSADVRALTAERASWTSYNSPKGRMLAVMRMVRDGDSIDLRMPRSLVEPVAKRLRMFVLRSKVSLSTIEPRATDLATEADDRLALIRAGVPVIYPGTQDRWVAQMANLDLIGGISFDKGCYTGQEIVARMHYLGNLKKRMFRVRGDGDAPPPGTAIRDAAGDGQAVGEIVDASAEPGAGFVATAVLQIALAGHDSLRLERENDASLQRPAAFEYAARGVGRAAEATGAAG